MDDFSEYIVSPELDRVAVAEIVANSVAAIGAAMVPGGGSRFAASAAMKKALPWSNAFDLTKAVLTIAFDGVVLTQRVTLPVVGHHDAAHIGMSAKTDAEEIEDLALIVIG